MAKDYYATLGVGKTATHEELKKAYKRLAKEYHPDLHKGNKEKEEKFKEINEAYKTLSDDKSRAHYDRFGDSSGQFQGFQNSDAGFNAGFNFSDIFEDFFGSDFGNASFGNFGRQRQRRGADLQQEMSISLEDAYRGISKKLAIHHMAKCRECNGTGAEKGMKQACSACNGSGTIKRTQRTAFGIFQTSTTCSNCHGEGTVAQNPCRKCNGHGIAEEEKEVEVKIPAGIDHMQALRLRGEGNAAKNGEAGDLFIVVRIKPHAIFTRKGNDVSCEIPINFTQAVLGDEVSVPTLEGNIKLKIPSGTQPGTVFRLKGKGMPSLEGYTVGNQLIRVTIDVPTKVTKKQRELLEEFSKGSEQPKARKSFFEKIKDAF